MSDLNLALIGNPNCGKTTLFNVLTGTRQKTGNWSGVTVERKEGLYSYQQKTHRLIDLPGVYSLSVGANVDTLDEQIARNYLVDHQAHVVVNVIDATNLERGLYLTAQLLEMRIPCVVALNMMDNAERAGLAIDQSALAERLDCPVVAITASRGQGLDKLKAAIAHTASLAEKPQTLLKLDEKLDSAVEALETYLNDTIETPQVNHRWLALKLLEKDPTFLSQAGESLQTKIETLNNGLPVEAERLIAESYLNIAHQWSEQVVVRQTRQRVSFSDRLDSVLLHPVLGGLSFLAIIYMMFLFTINFGGAFIDFFDMTAGAIFVDGLAHVLTSIGAPDWMRVILADGIGGGIQVVATFIPIIGTLYLFLSFLEDTGYLVRAAFLVDQYMRAIGLPGKAFVPLIVGFGCNVPSVMATRSLESQRDRLITIAMAPFMSCGARLAVYGLFAAAFFPVGGQNIVFLLYLLGILVAVLTGLFLKKSLLQGDVTPFMMELPSYRIPPIKSVAIHSWTRLKGFLSGAGQIIIIVVALLSFVNSWGTDGSFGNEDSDKSVLSALGRTMIPLFTPMGLDDENWPATVGIFTGIFAKEAVVGTLDALYGSIDSTEGASEGNEPPFNLGDSLIEAAQTIPDNLSGLGDSLTDPLGFGSIQDAETVKEEQEISDATFGAMVKRFDGKLGAFVYLLFILLYTPCVATIGAIKRESGNMWSSFVVFWTTSVAYGASVGVYQIGTFTQHPLPSGLWLCGIALFFAALFQYMKKKASTFELASSRPVSACSTCMKKCM